MNVLGISVEPEAEACATRLNGQRIYRAKQRDSSVGKRVRIKQRKEQVANREHLRGEEGELYGLYIAD